MFIFKNIHVLIPAICEYVTLYGKRGYADVTKFRVLRCGDYSGLSWWPLCNHRAPYKREAGGAESEKEL